MNQFLFLIIIKDVNKNFIVLPQKKEFKTKTISAKNKNNINKNIYKNKRMRKNKNICNNSFIFKINVKFLLHNHFINFFKL